MKRERKEKICAAEDERRGKYDAPSSDIVINESRSRIKFQVEWSMRNKDVVEPPALLSVEQGQKQEVSGQDPKIVG